MMRLRRNRALFDVFIIGLLALPVLITTVYFDAFDLVARFAIDHAPLDELLLAIPILGLLGVVFGLRRIVDLRREVIRRREAELRFDAAINNMPQGLVMFDGAARLVVCNKRYREMYSLPPEIAAPGRRLRDIIAYRIERGGLAADADQLAAQVRQLVEQGKPWKSVSELKNGKVIDILTHPMESGGWVATHDDVTEHRRAERHLQRTQKFLASVIENVPTAVTVKDARSLRYLLVNKAGENFFGLLRSEIVGKTAYYY